MARYHQEQWIDFKDWTYEELERLVTVIDCMSISQVEQFITCTENRDRHSHTTIGNILRRP